MRRRGHEKSLPEPSQTHQRKHKRMPKISNSQKRNEKVAHARENIVPSFNITIKELEDKFPLKNLKNGGKSPLKIRRKSTFALKKFHIHIFKVRIKIMHKIIDFVLVVGIFK